jgi:hypothetical protein
LRGPIGGRDNFFMRGITWIVAVAGLSACFDPPQEVLDDIVCSHVCDCFVVVDCQDACVAAVAPVTQECFDVVSANAQDCGLVAEALRNGGVCDRDIPEFGPDPE